MEKNISNNIVYYLSIEKKYEIYLGGIRHWNNLKMATDNELVWIKDLSEIQLNLIEIKSIPYTKLYYNIGNKLFLKNSKLPERNVPSLLWTPIDRALQVQMPSYNQNYFGLNETTNVQLITIENEQPSFGLLVAINLLQKYIETAPAVRLLHLTWVIIENNKALILGVPILPIQGNTYWRINNMLIPSGFGLELPILENIVEDQLNKMNDNWIVWNRNSTYTLIGKTKFKPLSISSFKKSKN